MFSIINIVLTLLGFAKSLMQWLHDRRMIQAGEDAAVARAALAVLETTAEGKRLRDHVKTLETAEEDALWDRMLKKEKP